MISSRLITDLTPDTQVFYWKFDAGMKAKGIPYMVTRTLCDQEMQDWIYASGRTRPGPILTHTRQSIHLKGEAFDIAILRDGKPVWDVKVDVNLDHVPDYMEAGKIGESVGLEWGGDWPGWKDFPHFQKRQQT